MTGKEKQQRKKTRDDLRKQGVLPPRKQRLNRKEYARMILERYKKVEVPDPEFYIALLDAIVYMVPEAAVLLSVSTEQIGVLKLLQVAMDVKEYKQQAEKTGRKPTHLELWEKVVKPIWNL